MGSSPKSRAPGGLGQLCHHQPACPGCPHFGEEGISAAARARLGALALRARAPEPEWVTLPGRGSRHRVRLSVRGTTGDIGIGIFQERSHRLVSIVDCPLHHPGIVEVTREIQGRMNHARVPPYQEARPPGGRASGLLRAVQLAVERLTGKVQLTLVVFARPGEESPDLLACRDVADALGRHHLVQGVFLNYQPLPTNTLLGDSFELLGGEAALVDESAAARVFFPPGAFGQANPAAHDLAVERIHGLVGGRKVMEYYAGVGTIGLGLLKRGNRVWFNEVAGGSLDGLALGLAASGRAADARVFSGPAEAHVEAFRLLGSDAVVVVDPPRKGLARELLQAFVTPPHSELLYLSCGLDSLCRDTEVLLDAGYTLAQVVAYPYFPYTDHVETLCRFVPPGAGPGITQ